MKNKLSTLFSIICLLLLPLATASAHGDITITSPGQDERLLIMPTEITLEFVGQLQTLGTSEINLISVTDSTGRVLSDTSSLVEGSKLSTKILLLDSTGLISVHYRIVSEDGHPVEGGYSFTVGQSPLVGSADDEVKNGSESGRDELQTLALPGIILILCAAISGFVIIRNRRVR